MHILERAATGYQHTVFTRLVWEDDTPCSLGRDLRGDGDNSKSALDSQKAYRYSEKPEISEQILLHKVVLLWVLSKS